MEVHSDGGEDHYRPAALNLELRGNTLVRRNAQHQPVWSQSVDRRVLECCAGRLLEADHYPDFLRAKTPKRVEVIHEGVDKTLFRPGPRSGRLDQTKFYIFSGGKVEYRKGHDLVLPCFQGILTWRKAYRGGRLGDIAGFVAAVIVPEQPEKVTGLGCRRIEIVSVNGRRVIVDCDVDVESLLRIMRGLETLP